MKLSAPVASADAAATGLSLRAALNVDVGLVARPEVSNIDGDVTYFGGRVGREVEHLIECFKKIFFGRLQLFFWPLCSQTRSAGDNRRLQLQRCLSLQNVAKVFSGNLKRS